MAEEFLAKRVTWRNLFGVTFWKTLKETQYFFKNSKKNNKNNEKNHGFFMFFQKKRKQKTSTKLFNSKFDFRHRKWYFGKICLFWRNNKKTLNPFNHKLPIFRLSKATRMGKEFWAITVSNKKKERFAGKVGGMLTEIYNVQLP